MADLPIFQATEQFQPTEVESGAALTANLGQLADEENMRVYKMAQAQADTNAIHAGSLAGQDINFQPVKGTGEAAQKFNQAALETNKYAIGSDILQNTKRLHLMSLDSDDPEVQLDTFNKTFKNYSDSVLTTIPEENKAYAMNMLAHQGGEVQTQLQKSVIKSRSDQLYAGFVQGFHLRTNEISNLARKGNLAQAATLLAEQRRNTETAMHLGLLTKKQIDTFTTQPYKEYETQNILGQYERVGQNTKLDADQVFKQKQQIRSDLMNKKQFVDAFDPVTRKSILSEFDKIDKGEVNKVEMSASQSKHISDNLLYQASQTGKYDAAQYAQFAEANPNKTEELDAKLNLAKRSFADFNSVANGSIQDMSAKALQLSGPLAKEEMDSPYAADIAASNKSTVNRLQAAIKQAKNDPGTYYAHAAAQAGIKTHQQMIDFERNNGVPEGRLNPVGLPEIMKDGDTLQNLPLVGDNGKPGKLDFLEQKQAEMGSAYPQYLNGLVINKQIDPVLPRLVDMQNNPESRQLLPEIQKSLEIDPSDIAAKLKTANINQQDINNAVATNDKVAKFTHILQSRSVTLLEKNEAGKTAPVKTTLEASLLDSMNKYASYLVAEKGVDISDAATQAYNAFIGSGVSEVNQQFWVPRERNPDTVHNVMNSIDSYVGDLSKHIPMVQALPKGVSGVGWADFIIGYKGGHWKNNTTDTGYVRVDQFGKPLVNPVTNQKVGFKYSEMDDPNFLKKWAPVKTKEEAHKSHWLRNIALGAVLL